MFWKKEKENWKKKNNGEKGEKGREKVAFYFFPSEEYPWPEHTSQGKITTFGFSLFSSFNMWKEELIFFFDFWFYFSFFFKSF